MQNAKTPIEGAMDKRNFASVKLGKDLRLFIVTTQGFISQTIYETITELSRKFYLHTYFHLNDPIRSKKCTCHENSAYNSVTWSDQCFPFRKYEQYMIYKIWLSAC